MLPDLVRATFMQCEALEECWANKDGDCLKTRENPHGIPIERASSSLATAPIIDDAPVSDPRLSGLFADLFCSEFFGHGMGSPLGAQCPSPSHPRSRIVRPACSRQTFPLRAPRESCPGAVQAPAD